MIDIGQLFLFGVPAIGLIAGLLELVKQFAKEYDKEIPKRLLPPLSIIIAILLFIVSGGYTLQGIGESVIYGLFVGLSACGGYDIVIKTFLNKNTKG